ncbi:hypothetical protein CEQ27_29235 (plasmid) [Escherichia coli O104:H4]|nr:hypothetical protein CEQ27_29235 [Escherichia coli O104:H4]
MREMNFITAETFQSEKRSAPPTGAVYEALRFLLENKQPLKTHWNRCGMPGQTLTKMASLC